MGCISNNYQSASTVPINRRPRIQRPQRHDIQQVIADRAKVWVEFGHVRGDVLTGRLAAHPPVCWGRSFLGGVDNEVEELEVVAPVGQEVARFVWGDAERGAGGLACHDPGEGVLLQLGDGDHGPGGCYVASYGGSGFPQDEAHCNEVWSNSVEKSSK